MSGKDYKPGSNLTTPMSKTAAVAAKVLPPNLRRRRRSAAPMSDFFSCDYFKLFGISAAEPISAAELQHKYESLQTAAHPDRFVGDGNPNRQAALQMSTRINDAYQTLQNPLRRAAYILSLHGIIAFAEDNTAMPTDFLMQQMEWREQLEDSTAAETSTILAEIQTARDDAERQTAELLATKQWTAAATTVRQWKYLEKMLADARQL